MMRKTIFYYVLVMFLSIPAIAGECTTKWTPTFVHAYYGTDKAVYYVQSGDLILMKSPEHAQQTCTTKGVKRTINGKSCRQRNWGDFSCGCSINNRNYACKRLKDYLKY